MPAKVAPSRLAFVLAAAILFLNAGCTALLVFASNGTVQYALAAIIDTVLGIYLIQLNERARYLAVIRAAIGLPVGAVMALQEHSVLSTVLVMFAQALLSGSLILLIAWETTMRRLIAGSVLATMYTAWLLLIAHGALLG